MYKVTSPLGKGVFGTVVGGTCRTSGLNVAIKLIDKIQTEPNSTYFARKILREIIILRKLSEFKDNIFSNKIVDIILPREMYLKK